MTITRKEQNKIYVIMNYYDLPTNTQYEFNKLRDEYIMKNSGYRTIHDETYGDILIYKNYKLGQIPLITPSEYANALEIELPITVNNKLKDKKKLIKTYGEKNINNIEQALTH